MGVRPKTVCTAKFTDLKSHLKKKSLFILREKETERERALVGMGRERERER